MTKKRHPLQTDLVVRSRVGFFIGDTRIRLLEAVAKHGSITRAAKAVPMSYKAAWDAIDEMNNLAPVPLVLRSVGGRHGGGANLTPYGVRMIALFRTLEQMYEASANDLAQALEELGDGDVDQLQSLLARLSVRSSARNQFVGTIEGLRGAPDDVDVEIAIRVDADFALCAVVTTDVVERLDLRLGLQVAALVPATSVFVSIGGDQIPAVRNRFSGRVLEVHRGPVNADVTIELPGGRTLSTTVTRTSADELQLEPGVEAQILFKASNLLLQRIAL